MAIPWTVEEFTEEATKVLHPFDATDPINDDVSRAVFQVATSGVAATEAFRLKQMAYYLKRAIALTEDEKALKAGLSVAAANLLSKKKILLFKEMWSDAGGDDPTLVTDLMNGFIVVGEAPASGAFEFRDAPATISVETVLKVAEWSQKAVKSATRGSGDKDMDAKVYETTLEERDRGWLIGPLSAAQVESKLGKLWIPSRRFGISQGGDVRNIDDYSEYLVNAAFGCFEKIATGGVDEICGAVRILMAGLNRGDEVALHLSSGEVLRGKLHGSLRCCELHCEEGSLI